MSEPRLVALALLLLAATCSAQQRVQFHASQMKAEWAHDPAINGERQRITGPFPAAVLSQMVYDEVGVWQIFTKRVNDATGLSWQAREILHENEWIDVDSKGNITVEIGEGK